MPSLLTRGFEIGGPAGNFRKRVVATEEPAIRAVALEILAVMIDVLRYDGTSALTFRLHQDSRAESGQELSPSYPYKLAPERAGEDYERSGG